MIGRALWRAVAALERAVCSQRLCDFLSHYRGYRRAVGGTWEMWADERPTGLYGPYTFWRRGPGDRPAGALPGGPLEVERYERKT